MIHNDYTTMLTHTMKQADMETEAAMERLAADAPQASVIERIGALWAKVRGATHAAAQDMAASRWVTGEFPAAP